MMDRLSQSVHRQVARSGDVMTTDERVNTGVHVMLSDVGRNRSQQASRNDDIDKSDLPDTIKDILKMIRALRQQIAEQMAKLQAIMADASLSPDSRAAQTQALQLQVSTLNGALSSASSSLLKAMQDAGLDDEQMQAVATLSMG
ncbi:hypothetical protein [Aquipseudomonas campi]